jgi:hypothetical protein
MGQVIDALRGPAPGAEEVGHNADILPMVFRGLASYKDAYHFREVSKQW